MVHQAEDNPLEEVVVQLSFNQDRLKQEFERDGFLILRSFLAQDELKELTCRTESLLSRSDQFKRIATRRAFQGVLKNLQKDDTWFDDLLLNGKQVKLISGLLDDDLEPATAAYFERTPGEDQGIDPHFDAIGHRRPGATLWISLDRATVENGCLYYLKGSHKDHYESKVGIKGIDRSDPCACAIELEPGDASIHSSLTIHWSNPNKSEIQRRAISLFYWARSL